MGGTGQFGDVRRCAPREIACCAPQAIGRRAPRAMALAGVLIGVLVVAGAGCGSDPTVGAVAATTPTTIAAPTTTRVTITTAPPTTAPPTTVPSTTMEETTTTVVAQTTTTVAETTTSAVPETTPPATVAASLPTPVAPPANPYAAEQQIGVGTIEIPRIGVSKQMFEGVTLTTLNSGPGHWPGTAMPGEAGNVVIGGHRVSHDKPFRNIDKLTPGDEVVFTNDAGRFVYQVTGTEIVTPDAIRIIDQTPEKTATLFACTPPGSTSHRIVVHLALSA